MEPSVAHKSPIQQITVFVLGFGLLAVACGDSTQNESEAETVKSSQTAPECTSADVMNGRVEARENQYDFAAYEYRLDKKNGIQRMSAFNTDDEKVATYETKVAGRDIENRSLRIVQSYSENGNEVITTDVKAQRSDGLGMTAVGDFTFKSEDKHLRYWLELSEAMNLEHLSVGRPVSDSTEEPSVGERVRREGTTYDVLTIGTSDGDLNTQDFNTWLQEVGMQQLLDSPANKKRQFIANHRPLLVKQLRHLDACRSNQSNDLVKQQSALQNTDTRRSFQCNGDNAKSLTDTLSTISDAKGYADTVKGAMDDTAKNVPARGFGPPSAGTLARGVATNAMKSHIVGAVAQKVADTLAPPALEFGFRSTGHDAAADFYFGDSSGDPHLTTLDGLSYDFQAAGEFIYTESLDSDFVVQVREEPVEGAKCANVTYNTAIATRVGNATVNIYARRNTPLWVDGEPTDLTSGFISFDNGARLLKTDNGDFRIEWPNARALVVDVRGHLIDLHLETSASDFGRLRGLMGRFNNDPSDDLALRDGTIIGDSIGWERLYGEYADSWRISPSESLFDYQDDKSTEDFQRPEIPTRPTTLENLPTDDIEQARQACRDAGITNESILQDCTIDVACTGDSSYTDSHTGRAEPENELDVKEPIFMDNWKQQGTGDSDNWEVSQDGRSVVQTENIDPPTMFVSTDDYIDTTIRGDIEIQTNDDNDVVGFVFGYQKPIAENGDAADNYDMYVLQWRKEQDGWQGFTGREGFALSRVDGQIPDSEHIGPFWGYVDTEQYTLLDSKFDEDQGWESNKTYDFALSYRDNRLQISIDGDLIFDLSADEAGVSSFQNGRFGFYNYSQASVRYGGFTSTGSFQDLSEGPEDVAVSGDIQFISPPGSTQKGELEHETDAFIFQEQSATELSEALTLDIYHPGDYGRDIDSTLPNYGSPGDSCEVTPSGVEINSYLIHVDPVQPGRRFKAEIQMPNPIAALISSTSTLNSTDETLGGNGIEYPSDSDRGLEYGADGISFDRQSNTIKLDVKTGRIVEQIRVITYTNRASPSENGSHPKTCSELAREGETDNGVYTIDPDGENGTPPFETYCVFNDDTGYTMVSKIATGQTDNASCSWAVGALNGRVDSSQLDPATKASYGNRIVQDYWNKNGISVDEIGLDLYRNGSSVKQILFNARDSDPYNWFRADRVMVSSWNDLASASHNVFDLQQGAGGGRDFLINHEYNGCGNETGWLVADSDDSCGWNQQGNGADAVDIRYSTGNSYTNWLNDDVETADTMAIFVSSSQCTQQSRGDSDYLFCPQSKTWNEAGLYCTPRGGQLVSINSEAEGKWLRAKLQSPATPDISSAWLGLNDRDTEGSFVWQDGSSAGYTNWASGEPTDSTQKNCVSHDGSNWHTRNCDDNAGFICGF